MSNKIGQENRLYFFTIGIKIAVDDAEIYIQLKCEILI